MSRTRSVSRERLVQALYQWLIGGQAISDIERHFIEDQDMAGADLEYFGELLHQIPASVGELRGHLDPFLNRPLDKVDPVERAILLLGSYELAHRSEVPYRVVINEGVELAKTYGGTDGHRFINGVLDKVAQQLRSAEVSAKR